MKFRYLIGIIIVLIGPSNGRADPFPVVVEVSLTDVLTEFRPGVRVPEDEIEGKYEGVIPAGARRKRIFVRKSGARGVLQALRTGGAFILPQGFPDGIPLLWFSTQLVGQNGASPETLFADPASVPPDAIHAKLSQLAPKGLVPEIVGEKLSLVQRGILPSSVVDLPLLSERRQANHNVDSEGLAEPAPKPVAPNPPRPLKPPRRPKPSLVRPAPDSALAIIEILPEDFYLRAASGMRIHRHVGTLARGLGELNYRFHLSSTDASDPYRRNPELIDKAIGWKEETTLFLTADQAKAILKKNGQRPVKWEVITEKGNEPRTVLAALRKAMQAPEREISAVANAVQVEARHASQRPEVASQLERRISKIMREVPDLAELEKTVKQKLREADAISASRYFEHVTDSFHPQRMKYSDAVETIRAYSDVIVRVLLGKLALLDPTYNEEILAALEEENSNVVIERVKVRLSEDSRPVTIREVDVFEVWRDRFPMSSAWDAWDKNPAVHAMAQVMPTEVVEDATAEFDTDLAEEEGRARSVAQRREPIPAKAVDYLVRSYHEAGIETGTIETLAESLQHISDVEARDAFLREIWDVQTEAWRHFVTESGWKEDSLRERVKELFPKSPLLWELTRALSHIRR